MTTAAILEVRGLRKEYGDFAAVAEVDLTVRQGTVHSVIGPNGAGKTTLFRLLTGVVRPTRGQILLDGRHIGGRPPHIVARQGLSQTFQITSLFKRLTVIESVQLAILAGTGGSGKLFGRAAAVHRREALDLVDSVGLAEFAGTESAALSHGDQRALEIALALATKPRLLLMDEPTAGMSPFETDRVIKLVSRLARDDGLTVVLSEHDMDIVFGISSQVTVMHQGRVIAAGDPDKVRSDPLVSSVYMGEEPRC